jgi:hypothetical protein
MIRCFGFVFNFAVKIPEQNETIAWKAHAFLVTAVESHRINTVKITARNGHLPLRPGYRLIWAHFRRKRREPGFAGLRYRSGPG